MKFEHDTVLQEYGVDRKPDIRQFHKLPGIHKEPKVFIPFNAVYNLIGIITCGKYR